MNRQLVRLAVGAGAAVALIVPATTVAAAGPSQLYNSTVPVASVGNLPSVGAEAYASAPLS